MMNNCMIVVFSAVLLLSFCASGQKCKNGCDDNNDCTSDKCVAGSCQHDQIWNSASTPPSGCCKADADCTNDNQCIFGICETSKFKCRYITQCNPGSKPPASVLGEPIACSSDGDCIRENDNICLATYCNAGVCSYNVKDIKGCCRTSSDCPTLPCRDVSCYRKTKQCIWSNVIRTAANEENCDEAIPSDFFREPIGPFSSFYYYQPEYYISEGSSSENNPPPPSSPDDEPGAGDIIGAIIGFVILGLLVIAFIIVIIMILIRNLWRRVAGKQ